MRGTAPVRNPDGRPIPGRLVELGRPSDWPRPRSASFSGGSPRHAVCPARAHAICAFRAGWPGLAAAAVASLASLRGGRVADVRLVASGDLVAVLGRGRGARLHRRRAAAHPAVADGAGRIRDRPAHPGRGRAAAGADLRASRHPAGAARLAARPRICSTTSCRWPTDGGPSTRRRRDGPEPRVRWRRRMARRIVGGGGRRCSTGSGPRRARCPAGLAAGAGAGPGRGRRGRHRSGDPLSAARPRRMGPERSGSWSPLDRQPTHLAVDPHRRWMAWADATGVRVLRARRRPLRRCGSATCRAAVATWWC